MRAYLIAPVRLVAFALAGATLYSAVSIASYLQRDTGLPAPSPDLCDFARDPTLPVPGLRAGCRIADYTSPREREFYTSSPAPTAAASRAKVGAAAFYREARR